MPISLQRRALLAAVLHSSAWHCLGDRDAAEGPHEKLLENEDDSVDCNPRTHSRPVEADAPFGALHDVVGHDGVLMISMERNAQRYDHSAAKLRKARIFPTKFSASDGFCDAQQQLRKGCYAVGSDESKTKCVGGKQIDEKKAHDKSGSGCSHTEQAIADSHRRALAAASERKKKWTAILEEDVVPVRPERWDKAFKRAWKMVPKETKIVRLSYCMYPNKQYQTQQHVFKDAGEFMLAKWHWAPNSTYSPSGCTGGYLVHRDIIPEILSLFPCCCALDCCLEWDFFNKKVNSDHSLTRGMQVVMNMDAWGATEYARDFVPYDMHQNGVLVQDCREMPSMRDASDK